VILSAIAHAQCAGARLAPACQIVGISARTIERWQQQPDGDDRRCGPHRRPTNALSPAEQAQIIWLPTTVRGVYLHLYLVMDVWSRRIVGWRVADADSAEIAAELVTQACRDGNVDPRGLVLHSDNGKPMRASTMITTLQWLGMVPSFSRPHVSDDNPTPSRCSEPSNTPRLIHGCPLQTSPPERIGSLALSIGTTPSIATARSVMSRPSSGMMVGNKTSWPAATNSTNGLAVQTRNAGRGDTRNWNPIDVVVLNPQAEAASDLADPIGRQLS
jgi:hypothetical protein